MNAASLKNSSAEQEVSVGSAMVAGLIGSLGNTLAIRVVQATGIAPGAGGLAKMVTVITGLDNRQKATLKVIE